MKVLTTWDNEVSQGRPLDVAVVKMRHGFVALEITTKAIGERKVVCVHFL